MNKTTILDLLNKFSQENANISWEIKCLYSDGKGTTINRITLLKQPHNHSIGIFTYEAETGKVHFCSYKKLKKPNSENIIDLLLDMINYAKVNRQ